MTLEELLRARYRDEIFERQGATPSSVLLFEVTDPNGPRRADALLVHGWRSRGYAVEHFELKSARSDWLRELADPAKSEPFVRVTSRTWVVAPTGVVQPGELPVGWGYLQARGEKLVAVKRATRRNPPPLSPAWIATLVRHAVKCANDRVEIVRREERATFAEKLEREREKLEARGLDPDGRLEDLAELRRRVARFEELTGSTLEGWPGQRFLSALESLRDAGVIHAAEPARVVTEQANSIDRAVARLSRQAGRLRELAQLLESKGDQ